MKIDILTLFSLIDGRLFCDFGKVHQTYEYIFNQPISTIGLVFCDDVLKVSDLKWYTNLIQKVTEIKKQANANNFEELRKYLLDNYTDVLFEVGRI